MKSILISIRPQYVEKILNGEKTIEIRTTMPKCELPCKVYIYCTKKKPYLYRVNDDNKFELTNKLTFQDSSCFVRDYKAQNGKVVAEFTLNKIENMVKHEKGKDFWNFIDSNYIQNLLKKSCLSMEQIVNYVGDNKDAYAWHIDDLKIYNKPKELSEFGSILKRMKGKESRFTSHLLKRPPQSWCYVESLEEKNCEIYC